MKLKEPILIKLLPKETKPPRNRRGEYMCDCGNIFISRVDHIESGHTKSCGCWRWRMLEERNFKHGKSRIEDANPEYRTWLYIKRRCNNINDPKYYMYGGRGIKVCDEWVNNFPKFLEDMGNKPSSKHSIDRIDNDKGYYKENCRWATNKEQCNNKRNNIIITFKGKTQSVDEWSKELNIKYSTLTARIRGGKSIEECFKPPKQYKYV